MENAILLPEEVKEFPYVLVPDMRYIHLPIWH